MSFDDFATRWRRMDAENKLATAANWALLPPGLSTFLRHDEMDFLRQTGLPDNAPCFSFEEVKAGMPRVDEVIGPHDKKLWARVGRDTVAAFRVLGDDGGGNPLVLNVHSRDIWLLDHEADFVPFNLVNSGLAQLAESLLLFAQAESQEAESETEVLHKQLLLVDPRAAVEGTFWHEYVECFNDFL